MQLYRAVYWICFPLSLIIIFIIILSCPVRIPYCFWSLETIHNARWNDKYHKLRKKYAHFNYVYKDPLYLALNAQFNSVAQSYLTLCDHMDCSTPGFHVHHQLPDLAQTHVHWVGDAIQPSHPLIPFSSHLQFFPVSGSFPVSQFFTSGAQRIGVSASASVLPMNIQDWFPLGWTRWISLQSKGLSRVFSNTTV